MKHTRPYLLSLVACLATTGCTVTGRTLVARQTPYRHPAVNWVYESGGQYGWKQLLLLPIPFGHPAFFSHSISSQGVQGGRVMLSEHLSLGCGASGLWGREDDPIGIELDLKTGKVIREYAQAPFPRFRDLPDVPSYQVVFDFPDVVVNWQGDSATHSTKILTLSRGLSSGYGGAAAERISETLLIYLSRWVISINLNLLSTSPGSPASSP